ncbi:uncharacterized protein [Macrobrachium rosenbergii]|uniref:uncharacterized protein n=1 Tax=Macrobrachium rosenbergii TaxID=79674 RepID=UPI0034D6B280
MLKIVKEYTTQTNILIDPSTQKWRLSQVGGQLPHLPCRLREYVADDVTRCLGSRSRNQTHILYVGDSRIRQHVEVMIDLLRDLQLRITTYKGEVLSAEEFLGEKGMKFWSKYKHHFRVESLKVPGLLVEFKWAAFLDWGDAPKKVNDNFSFWMKRLWTELDLTVWPDWGKETKPAEHQKTRVGAFEIISRLNASPKENLPDIVLLNTGAWFLTEYYQMEPLEAIDLSSIVVMDTLRQLLSELADRTTVVWLAPDPFKEHISHIFDHTGKYSYETNAFLEWQLNAQALLKPSGVLFWDTFLPISYASREDCMYFSSENVDFASLPKYAGFRPLLSWNCQERAHVGFEAIGVAVQMVLNHLCNPHLGEGYCCSEMHT